jgi:hypothetical protein
MKVRTLSFLTAATVLFPLTAFAMDDTPSADRILSDPLYQPMQGQLYGDSTFSWATTTQDVFNATGVKTSSQRVTDNDFSQILEYGVTDDLAFAFDMGYDGLKTKTSPTAATEFSRSSVGWTDPTFGVVYRVLDQRDNPLTLNLRGAYSPDWINAKTATDTADGTIARGGDVIDLGATLGREMRGFTIAGTFDAIDSGTRNETIQSTGGNLNTSSYWGYTLGLATQTRFTDQLSLNLGAGYTFGHDANIFNSSSGLAHETHVGATPNLNAALNYHFIPNVLVGSVGYEHEFGGDSDNIYATATNNTEIHNHQSDILNVGLRYQFQ